MRILFATPYVPSLVRIRAFSFIKYLGQRHEVDVLALDQGGSQAKDIPLLSRYCERFESVRLSKARSLLNCLTALPSRTPLQGAYCSSTRFGKRLSAMLDQCHYDVVHVEHIRAAYLARWIGDVPSVYDSVDSISLLWERLLQSNRSPVNKAVARFELPRTRHYEATLIQSFDKVLVTSLADKMALERLDSSSKSERISVVPNGVHLAYPPGESERDAETIVFSGKMSYHANVDAVQYFCREILPVVRNVRPNVVLTIVGSDPPAEIMGLADDPHICVTGVVPDVRPYLRRAAVAVAPIRYAVGIQNKVLEAMAMDTPVVATSIACGALNVLRGEDCLIADDPDHFANQVVRLLSDEARRKRIGANGRRYVEMNHEWSSVVARLSRIYEEVIAEHRERRTVRHQETLAVASEFEGQHG